jgi:hypothetical protein
VGRVWLTPETPLPVLQDGEEATYSYGHHYWHALRNGFEVAEQQACSVRRVVRQQQGQQQQGLGQQGQQEQQQWEED